MKSILCTSLCMLAISTSAHALDGRAQAHAYNSKGSERHNAQVNSFHQASFINDTDAMQTIKVTYRICAQFHPCEDNVFNINVAPNDSWTAQIHKKLIVKYNNPGKYKTSAETTIEGPVYRREFSQAKIEIE